jgi:hypothetical protein
MFYFIFRRPNETSPEHSRHPQPANKQQQQQQHHPVQWSQLHAGGGDQLFHLVTAFDVRRLSRQLHHRVTVEDGAVGPSAARVRRRRPGHGDHVHRRGHPVCPAGRLRLLLKSKKEMNLGEETAPY